MARTLFLRIDPTAIEASWQLVDNDQLAGPLGKGRLADARKAAHGAHVVVLIPSEEVFLSNVTLPGKNRKKLLKALPYAVEDQLVDNVEDLHFALGTHSENGQFLVAAVDQKLMDYWDQAFKAATISVDTIVPDVSALLASSDDWTILLEPDRALMRSSNGLFACDIPMLPVMFTNLYMQAGDNKPEQVTVYDCSQADHMTILQTLTDDINFKVIECTEGVFNVFAKHYLPRRAVNLMQGNYSRKENISKHLRPWIPAAALFCVWIAWQLVLNVGEYIDLAGRSDELTTEMGKVYKSAFVRGKPPAPGYERVYMEKQFNELLKRQGKSAGGLGEMLVKTAPVLKNVKGINITSMRFLGGNLDIELTIKQASEIESLKEKLSSQTGWEVESKATTDKGVTKVRLKIKGKS